MERLFTAQQVLESWNKSCIDKSLMIGNMIYIYSCLDFPREYFATKEEAEMALKDMQGV